jgi:hypothetical protein
MENQHKISIQIKNEARKLNSSKIEKENRENKTKFQTKRRQENHKQG